MLSASFGFITRSRHGPRIIRRGAAAAEKMNEFAIGQLDEKETFENTLKILTDWSVYRRRRRLNAAADDGGAERKDGYAGDLWEIELPKNSRESFRVKALLLDDGWSSSSGQVEPKLWVSARELWSILFRDGKRVDETALPRGDFETTVRPKMDREWGDLTRNSSVLLRRLKSPEETMIDARGVAHLFAYSAEQRPYASLVFARMKTLESMVAKRVKERLNNDGFH